MGNEICAQSADAETRPDLRPRSRFSPSISACFVRAVLCGLVVLSEAVAVLYCAVAFTLVGGLGRVGAEPEEIAPMSHAPVAGLATPFLSALTAARPRLVKFAPAPIAGEPLCSVGVGSAAISGLADCPFASMPVVERTFAILFKLPE